MRRVSTSFLAIAVIVVLSGAANAAPRERERGPKEKDTRVVRLVKSIIRALGDGLTPPLP
jgi:hypothetical protein